MARRRAHYAQTEIRGGRRSSSTVHIMPLSLRLAALAATSAALLAPSAADAQSYANQRVVGISDQHAKAFTDKVLLQLPMKHARLVVPWDAMRHPYQIAEVDNWMRETTAAGIRPMVTFGPARKKAKVIKLPSLADYTRLTRLFRVRYPQVQEYSPWNEPNVAYSKRANDPARIAQYYRLLKRTCPTCTVLGVDIVDSSTLDDWIKAYLKQFPGPKPKHWGLHNYVDAHTQSSWGTRTLLKLVPGEIWFTETGGIYRRPKPKTTPKNDRRRKMKIGPAYGAKAVRRVFSLADISPRVKRVYIYHWKDDPKSSWDSGLLTAGGNPRSGYYTFAQQLKAGQPPASG